VRGNSIACLAGFLLASRGTVEWLLLATAIGGTALVIAGACVANNIIDRRIDARMDRTKQRALVVGSITIERAALFSLLLTILGIGVLAFGTNALTAWIGLIGFVFYTIVYGYAKRVSPAGTLVGSISGSMPLVAGYTAVSGQFNSTAGLLFLSMATWQMPHFYAIALFRLREYRQAKLPVLPLIHGTKRTKYSIFYYQFLFLASNVLLSFQANLSTSYLFAISFVVSWWVLSAIRSFHVLKTPTEKWARQVFANSLKVLLLWSVLLSVDHWLA
jgi:protoheme IX farnesyltransferase